ncbi:disease resistance protein L6-like [Macadamia integrifolia]|uniref:disease resistance protein L6-like n=1 Tax=Macadamia integrifolia TaxID=60698 RepID=UPI001C5019B1|nr:disease resistance protein L6-like [Macadamia integrifolia]
MESQVGFSDYDVFINFSGEDTRNVFVGHLYNALKGRGIRAFIDSKDLWKGEDIGKLLSLIKGVKLSVAVFSQRYVESEWCLKELAQMLECHKANRQIIFPIFFKVKTSDVKNQTGCFQISSQMHSEEEPETVSIWKDALRAAGDVSGWVFDDWDDQSELVEEVVQNAWIRLEKVPLIDAKHPVGLRSHVESVLSLLSNTSNSSSMDVQFLGICGPGGIGKTTIATAVYNCIFENFTKSCFLEDVREQASQQNGKISLQKKLLYGISRVKTNICSSTEGSRLIKDRLQNVKTLLILDDVGDHIQLNWLARDLNWFGPKSRIIITTRDQSVLSGVPESNRKIYEPAELNKEESLRLFSLYAFSTDQPPDDFMELSIDLVGTTGGLPLALEVLGSDLSMTKDEGDKLLWNSMLRMLKQIPHDAVFEKLKISFDNLHDIEKAMFLDVACLFVGWKVETVISIWEACGFAPRYRMEVLKRKSLLKIRQLDTWINHKEFWMHDQIRDMGRRIAYNQRPEDPYKHSRLWSRDNIMKVLNGCKGNEIVEALLLKFDVNDSTCLHTKDFEKMPELRLLQVDGATLWGSFQCLPSKLRWLSWQTCPLKKLPDNFYHEHLVILDLNGGFFGQAWNNWHGNKETFIWGNIESWRQIWIPLQQKTHEDDPRGRRYKFPDDDDDDDEIYRCRLIMHVSLGFYHYIPEEIPLEYVKRLSLEVDSRIHHKDERITDCRVGVAIEGIIKLNHLNHIDYIHEFEGFDWFGFQLEGKNAIDIAHDYKGFIENTDIEFTVRGVNLFLVKEGPMFDTHQFSTECHCPGRRFLEIIRYN